MSNIIIQMFSQTKSRTLIILIAGVFIVTAGVLIYTFRNNATVSPAVASAIRAPQVQASQGDLTSERYQELIKQDNQKRAEEARETGRSAIPTITGVSEEQLAEMERLREEERLRLLREQQGLNPDGTNVNDPFMQALAQSQAQNVASVGGAGASGDQTQANAADALRALLEQQRLAELSAQQNLDAQANLLRSEQLRQMQEKQLQTLTTNMEKQLNLVFQAVNDIQQQTYVSGEFAPSNFISRSGNNEGDGNTAPIGSITQPPGQQAVQSTGNALVKAGDVLYGVIDTSVNSDEPSPILATVVEGKLKGSKLVGTIETFESGKKVVLRFNTINIPGRPASVGANIVAIDADTARTALASSVDNHYLLRYGSLFASAFLQGYGQAVSESGTVVTTQNGTTQTQNPPLNGKEQFFAGLGQLGASWSQALGENFNRKPTVFVNEGTGVGLLFLNDLVIN